MERARERDNGLVMTERGEEGRQTESSRGEDKRGMREEIVVDRKREASRGREELVFFFQFWRF